MELQKDEILSVLKGLVEGQWAEYHISRIGVFGSIATGMSHAQSDIDVVVFLDKQDFFILAGIKQTLEDIFHAKVDVVSYRENMNAFLKNRIDKEAIYA